MSAVSANVPDFPVLPSLRRMADPGDGLALAAAELAVLDAVEAEVADRGFDESPAFADGTRFWCFTDSRGPDLWVCVETGEYDLDGAWHPGPLTVRVQYDGHDPSLTLPLNTPDLIARLTAELESPYPFDRAADASAALFTHPDHGCTDEGCSAVQFMCPRCGVHGFGDHCAQTWGGAPVALCFNCDRWVTGRFPQNATVSGAKS